MKREINRSDPFIVQNCQDHTMGSNFLKYLAIKIHPLIDENDYKGVTVIGSYRRDLIISSKEKTGKLYNWQRPTISKENSRLTVHCFPGYDYVKHYAGLIASYLTINKRDDVTVKYILPSEIECMGPLINSDLKMIPKNRGIILGYGLPIIFPELEWKELDNYYYSVKKFKTRNYTLLIIKHSIWGDISGRLVKLLANLDFKRVIYIGKVGGLDNSIVANENIATGETSLIEGEFVSWNNIFKNAKSNRIVRGNHLTIPSVVFETKKWLSSVSPFFQFVDPEIGHMVRAANHKKIEFSYLHMITDNVLNNQKENLSNERDMAVITKRMELLKIIRECLLTSL